MSKADFLLEIAVIVLDTPAQLGKIDERRSDMFGSTVVSQYWWAWPSPLGHSMSSVSSAKRASPRSAQRARAHGQSAMQLSRLGAFPPRDGAPGALGQAERQCFDADARALGSSSRTGRTLRSGMMAAT